MSRRSSNGIRNLRAVFEGEHESTTPISRGRSPAGSESALSDCSRPVSKVRTSFITVNRSDKMGPQLGQQKSSINGEAVSSLDGSIDSTTNLNSNTPESVEKAINAVPSSSSTETAKPSVQAKEKDGIDELQGVNGDNSLDSNSPTTDVSSISPDKKISATKDDTANSESAVSGGAAVDEEPGELGGLLKGSPFESKSSTGTKPEALEAQNLDIDQGPSSSSKLVTLSADAMVNGHNEETTETSQVPVATSNPTRPVPSIASTKEKALLASAGSAATSNGTSSRAPITRLSTHTASNIDRQLPSKNATPRQSVPKPESYGKTAKEHKKAAVGTAGRSSLASTTSGVPSGSRTKQALTASDTKSIKKTNSISPITKLRPKSPTRPARLPTSATASTASSAAKLDSQPNSLSRSPSRASIASTASTSLGRKPSTLRKDRTTASLQGPAQGTASYLRKKSSRTSLPASNAVGERRKPRISTAESKAPEEGFLARMMRPTQSSASKIHEKAEPSTPPKKGLPVRLKRKSDEKGGVENGSKLEEIASGLSVQTEVPDATSAIEGAVETSDGPSGSAPPLETKHAQID
ncbi:hypothetical protein MMC12_001948 [Toensbergia leucococca]|nr:hypothetical protein [Toensbergia leucococca]